MTTEETNIPNQPSTVVHRYAIIRMQTNSYTPRISGDLCAYASVIIAEKEFLHPDAYVLFNCGVLHNEQDLTSVIMNQI